MKKKIICLLLCASCFSGTISLADEAYEQEIAERYGLSEKSVEFMREHNVDFSLFEGVEVLPEDHPINYNTTIESLIMQAGAYGFTDEQINAYISGSLSFETTIYGGKYDNTGRKRVYVPEYPFVVNGISLDYSEAMYPLIVYNDITYFPMTWHHCRMLGITTRWESDTNELFIKREDSEWEIPDYGRIDNTEAYLYAPVADYDIYVNDKKIDNSSEEYPILTFRKVTYFPMTWEYMAEEFGWSYTFDNENGLVINSVEEK